MTPAGAPANTNLRLSARTTQLLAEALAEDLGSGDVTTERTAPAGMMGAARLFAKAEGVFCGAPVAARVFKLADPAIRIRWMAPEGSRVKPGDPVAEMTGPYRGLLTGERVALNFLQRLSGVATLTRTLVDRAAEAARKAGLERPPEILDTRKTTPLWRELERYAVRMGGGVNHRFGLFDMVLMKENHIRAAGGVSQAIRAARKGRRVPIGVEARNEAELVEALDQKPDLILLDNMTPAQIRKLAGRYGGRGIPLEVSGGIGPANIGAYAATGVDRISVGSLTHSAPALDLSLQIYSRDEIGKTG